MAKERSEISGGGYRTTEHVEASTWTGRDDSYVITNDYSEHGCRWVSGTKTDSNGDVWNVDSSGRTTDRLGNDGRHDD